jgi:hypothetical protein
MPWITTTTISGEPATVSTGDLNKVMTQEVKGFEKCSVDLN